MAGEFGFPDVMDIVAAALAGFNATQPEIVAIQRLAPYLTDAFGALAGTVDSDDPNRPLPEDVAAAIGAFLGSGAGAVAGEILAPFVGAAIIEAAALAGITVAVTPLSIGIITALSVYGLSKLSGWAFEQAAIDLVSPLLNVIHDPLILDLDGDGIELTALDGSTVHFDYDQDGFAEQTGWVSSDDGILTIDANQNGVIDGASELFGSPDQDGFAVLETLDSNSDGKIDAGDELFSQLRVWRDFDQDGVSDAGELISLTEANISSISLLTSAVNGLNNGHIIGFEALFTKTDGSTGIAQSVYFQTDRQDTTGDNTPSFTPADGVLLLPQFQGSGQINSIAWVATQDATFRDAWTALTDEASTLSFDELRGRFEALVLKWASVEGVDQSSRGQYVDAQHLTFVEKFFGSTYLETHVGLGAYTSPSTAAFGAQIEASFDQIVDVLLTAFLAQSGQSVLVRGGELEDLLSGPYFAYALLSFESADAEGYVAPPRLGILRRLLS